jgi:hypothetical protein
MHVDVVEIACERSVERRRRLRAPLLSLRARQLQASLAQQWESWTTAHQAGSGEPGGDESGAGESGERREVLERVREGTSQVGGCKLGQAHVGASQVRGEAGDDESGERLVM